MKLKKDQRGTLSPMLIIIIIVAIGVVGFAGYKVFSTKKSTSNKSATVPAQAKEEAKEACMKEVNDKDLCKFLSNWESSKTYKATFASTDAEGKKSVMRIEADGDNSSSVVLDGEKETAAFITANKVYYMKDEEKGVWYKMPSTQTPPAADTNPVSKLNEETKEEGGETKNTTTYKKIGKETCGNTTCFKYQVIDTSDTDTVESFVWFGDNDYKLVRWTTKSKDGSTSDSTFSYEKVSVVAPSPTQDYPMPDVPQ